MRVLSIHTQGGGVGYYRHWMPARALARDGVKVTCFGNELGFFHEIAQREGGLNKWMMEEGWNYDVVHMGYSTILDQITLVNGALRNMAKELHDKNLPVAVDIDDDPHNVPTYNTAFKQYTREAAEKKALLIHLRTADGVSVTKDALGKSLWRDVKSATVLPNYTDPGDWDHFPVDPRRGEDKSIRVMFAGGAGHYGDLETIKDELIQIMDKYDGKDGKPMVRVFWLGCTPDWSTKWMEDRVNPLANRGFYIQPCHVRTYHQALRWISPDILIAPIEHNIFNESKSCIKAYDAVTANAAFLCSDWPTYEEVPEDCALKFSNNIQFKEMLEHLILDKGLREKRAKSLREWVLTERRIDTHISKWKDFYANLADSPVVGGIADVVRPRIITGDEDV